MIPNSQNRSSTEARFGAETTPDTTLVITLLLWLYVGKIVMLTVSFVVIPTKYGTSNSLPDIVIQSHQQKVKFWIGPVAIDQQLKLSGRSSVAQQRTHERSRFLPQQSIELQDQE